MLNLDIENFEFPFYFDSFDKLKEYHSNRLLVYPDLVTSKEGTIRNCEYLNMWEKSICENDPNEDEYYSDVSYTVNEYNFRGNKTIDDIDSNTDLCSGCSVSFGFGVKEEDTWPVLTYGETCVNLALPSASPSGIVRHLSGILDYKTPRSITILFSTVDRIDSFYEHDDKWKEIVLTPGIIRTSDPSDPYDKVKRTMYENFVLGTNEPFNYLIFFTNLELLISKAKSKGIQLYLSSWHHELRYVLKHYQDRGYTWFDIPQSWGRARDPYHPSYKFHRELSKYVKKAIN